MLTLAFALAASAAADQQPSPRPETEENTGTHRTIYVNGYPVQEDQPAKLDHILPEVNGTQITVTKKTTVTKLDQVPPIVDNDMDALFERSPGLQVSEQDTPTQYNISYRGTGNPQESEYILVLQDGIPIESDWIGFPTLYYVPMPQSLAEVQLIRGGSSLLYGPEPTPAVNFVSKRPNPKGPALTGSTQQIGGSDGLYSTYNELQGASGNWLYRADLGYVHSNGSRDNQKSYLLEGDAWLGYKPNDGQLFYLAYRGHAATAGNPGKLNITQYDADPTQAVTPFNRDWVRRGEVVAGTELDLANRWRVEAKAWYSTLQLYTRSAANGPAPATTTLQDEKFHNEGVDIRARKLYGRGNALTFGVTGTHSDAPFLQFTSTDITAGLGEHSGTPRLNHQRESWYGAVFAENVFRLPHRFHVVFSGRLENERIKIRELVKPPGLTRGNFDVDVSRTVPLLGVGFGNDFGRQNETYVSITQGYRPLRYFDVASPFGNQQANPNADAPNSTSYEAGVHGTPVTGLFYDVSLFRIDFHNRFERQTINGTDFQNVNTGDTRHQGFEGDISYDFLAYRKNQQHLILFANLSLLDAKFTRSLDPTQVGKRPAFAPDYVFKGGIGWREDGKFNVAFTAQAVGSQYFQDSNLPAKSGNTILVPALIPAYKLFELDGEYTIVKNVTVQAGIQNLTDERYYSRVFQNGIEPAPGRTFYAGVKFGF